MIRLTTTRSATALRRALVARAENFGCRIFLSDWTTVDWQSLTFDGERHQAGFVFTGAEAAQDPARWIDGIENAELDLVGACVVADIAVSGQPIMRSDGAVQVELEALTIAD